MNSRLLFSAFAAASLCGIHSLPSNAQIPIPKNFTIDFDTLTHPATGVGSSVRVYQEYGPGSFTLLRIPDAGDPATYGNHFHTVPGLGSPGHINSTAAIFFSDDGSPFLYFLGDYSGTTNSTYAPIPQSFKPFDLVSFTVLSMSQGPYVLTSSTGATIVIDHPGVYNAATTNLTGFRNIMSFRHEYAGAFDGNMVIDNIVIQRRFPAIIGIPIGR